MSNPHRWLRELALPFDRLIETLRSSMTYVWCSVEDMFTHAILHKFPGISFCSSLIIPILILAKLLEKIDNGTLLKIKTMQIIYIYMLRKLNKVIENEYLQNSLFEFCTNRGCCFPL